MKKMHLMLAMSYSVIYGQTAAYAQSADEAVLGAVTVTGQAEPEKLATTVKEREQLNKEIISDNRDLVRYEMDLGLTDQGGRRQKGFSMRGVEANRVGITFDDIAIPQSEENSLYSRYGNYNSSRITIDPELTTSVDLVKSSDSFGSGAGALGGNINYRSLETSDVIDKNEGFGGILRSGYSSKNDQWFSTLGVGYLGENIDTMLLYSQRKGHELKNHSGEDEEYTDKPSQSHYQHTARQTPDPQNTENKNLLFKLNYHLTPEHHVGLSLSDQKMENFTREKSYSLSDYYARTATDESQLQTGNLYYKWTPDSDKLSSLKVDYAHSKTSMASLTSVHSYEREGGAYNGEILGLKDPFQINRRYFDTKLNRLSLSVDSQSIDSDWGEHQLSLKASASRKDFWVLNDDINYGKSNAETIQYPTKTTNYALSLKDDIQWNETFSSQVGLRYDHTKISLEDLNAPCPVCLANGATKPEGKTFNNWSGLLGINAQLNDTWRTGYQISTGYRIPTGSEMYFTYLHPYGNWNANPDLDVEKSTNHTLSLKGGNEIGSLNASLYHNRYSNFITEGVNMVKESKIDPWTGQPAVDRATGQPIMNDKPIYQMVNVDKARVTGIELAGSLNLDKVTPLPEGWEFSGSLGYAKGKLSDGTSMMAIQPFKAVLGLDYEEPNGRWGILSRLSYLGGKKAKDAQYKEANIQYDWNTGSYQGQIEVKEKEYVNKPAFVFDLFGYYKPTNNFTIRGGVYNIFDKEYHTWDALRGINPQNFTSNKVDDAGVGLQRFTAPGRNVSVSMEYKF